MVGLLPRRRCSSFFFWIVILYFQVLVRAYMKQTKHVSATDDNLHRILEKTDKLLLDENRSINAYDADIPSSSQAYVKQKTKRKKTDGELTDGELTNPGHDVDRNSTGSSRNNNAITFKRQTEPSVFLRGSTTVKYRLESPLISLKFPNVENKKSLKSKARNNVTKSALNNHVAKSGNVKVLEKAVFLRPFNLRKHGSHNLLGTRLTPRTKTSQIRKKTGNVIQESHTNPHHQAVQHNTKSLPNDPSALQSQRNSFGSALDHEHLGHEKDLRDDAVSHRIMPSEKVVTVLDVSSKSTSVKKTGLERINDDIPSVETSVNQTAKYSLHPLMWTSRRGLKPISKDTGADSSQIAYKQPSVKPGSRTTLEPLKKIPKESLHKRFRRDVSNVYDGSLHDDLNLSDFSDNLDSVLPDLPSHGRRIGKQIDNTAAVPQSLLSLVGIAQEKLRNHEASGIARRDTVNAELFEDMLNIILDKNEDPDFAVSESFQETFPTRSSPENQVEDHMTKITQGNENDGLLLGSEYIAVGNNAPTDTSDLRSYQQSVDPVTLPTIKAGSNQFSQRAGVLLDALLNKATIHNPPGADPFLFPGFVAEPSQASGSPHGKKDLSRSQHNTNNLKPQIGLPEVHLDLPETSQQEDSESGSGQGLKKLTGPHIARLLHAPPIKRSVHPYMTKESLREHEDEDISMQDPVQIDDQVFDKIISDDRIRPEELVIDDRIPDDVALRRKRVAGVWESPDDLSELVTDVNVEDINDFIPDVTFGDNDDANHDDRTKRKLKRGADHKSDGDDGNDDNNNSDIGGVDAVRDANFDDSDHGDNDGDADNDLNNDNDDGEKQPKFKRSADVIFDDYGDDDEDTNDDDDEDDDNDDDDDDDDENQAKSKRSVDISMKSKEIEHKQVSKSVQKVGKAPEKLDKGEAGNPEDKFFAALDNLVEEEDEDCKDKDDDDFYDNVVGKAEDSYLTNNMSGQDGPTSDDDNDRKPLGGNGFGKHSKKMTTDELDRLGERMSNRIPGYIDDRKLYGLEPTGLDGPDVITSALFREHQDKAINNMD